MPRRYHADRTRSDARLKPWISYFIRVTSGRIRGQKIGFARSIIQMATPRQIEANRRNAQKSTGPRTPEGKAAVSMNSLRHGLRARTVVLPGENHQEFLQLCDDLEAEWEPLTRTEQFYVEQMAIAHWKLRRMEQAESDVHAKCLPASTHVSLLDRLWQAQCRMERSFARAQHELERIQTARNIQPQPQGVRQDGILRPAVNRPTGAAQYPPHGAHPSPPIPLIGLDPLSRNPSPIASVPGPE